GIRYVTVSINNAFLGTVTNSGSIVGGDEWNIRSAVQAQSAVQLEIRPVSPEELATAQDAPEEPYHAKAHELLLRNCVTVLVHGRSDSQKRSAALRLLIVSGARTIYEIARDTDLDQLMGVEFEPHCGYLLSISSEEIGQRLQRSPLDRLRHKVEPTQSDLVI